MHAYSSQKPSGQAERSNGTIVIRDAQHAGTAPTATARMKLQQTLNERPGVRSLMQLGDALNQRPSVSAQAALAQSLSIRSIVQRYTIVDDGSFQGKRSQHGRYVTGHDLSEMYARPGNRVERSVKTGETAAIDGRDYDVWEPSFEVIQDCVAAVEELMHGTKLKYGAPHISAFRDSAERNPFFGDSDRRNRKLGKETDLGFSADPGLLEGFVIVRQKYNRNEVRPPFHGATVVAHDGNDDITLETSAPTSGSISRDRVSAVYDMYGRNKTKKESFKHAYQAEYGTDATVSVIEPVTPLPRDVKAPALSTTVIDY